MSVVTIPEILGKATASQIIAAIQLQSSLEVWGSNIPKDRIEEIIRDLNARIKEQDDDFNRLYENCGG